MQAFDRIGTFRGTIQKSAVQQTKNGYPQFVVQLLADEHFDATGDLTGGEPGWVDWSPYEMRGTGFFVLYGEKGATASCTNLMALLGWDGRDFAALAAIDTADKRVLFRVVEDTYPQAKLPYKIDWIEDPDAPPVRELKSLDPAGLSKLTAKFGSMAPPPQKASAAKAAPAAAPAKSSTPPKAATPPKPAAPTPQATTSQSSSTDIPPVQNSDEAWASVCEHRGGLAEETVAQLWTEAVSFVSGGDPSKELTPEQWTQVRNDVLRDMTPA